MNLTEKDVCGITGSINEKKENPLLNDTTAEKISGIYKIINKVNGKYYVGSSNNIIRRWTEHKLELSKNRHNNDYLQKSYNKHGINDFDFIIIEKVSVDKLIETEQKYLDTAKQEKYKCYNLNFLADRVEMTDEVREKISKSNKGKHYMTEEDRLYLSKLNIGKPISKERKQKLQGKNNPNHNKTIYTFRNTKTNETFMGTCFELRTKYNLFHENISKVVSGERKSTGKWSLSQSV